MVVVSPKGDAFAGPAPAKADPVLFSVLAKPLGFVGDVTPLDAKEDNLLPVAAPKGEATPEGAAENGDTALAKLPNPELLKADSEVCGSSFVDGPGDIDACGFGDNVAKGDAAEVLANPLPAGIWADVS
jgi:hypothetical protein